MVDNQIILVKQMLAVFLYEYSCHFSGLSSNGHKLLYVRPNSPKNGDQGNPVASHRKGGFFPACHPAECLNTVFWLPPGFLGSRCKSEFGFSFQIWKYMSI